MRASVVKSEFTSDRYGFDQITLTLIPEEPYEWILDRDRIEIEILTKEGSWRDK